MVVTAHESHNQILKNTTADAKLRLHLFGWERFIFTVSLSYVSSGNLAF